MDERIDLLAEAIEILDAARTKYELAVTGKQRRESAAELSFWKDRVVYLEAVAPWK